MKERGNGRFYSKMGGLVLGLNLIGGCGFEVVDTGYRGILTRYGEIQGEPLAEGLYFYNPFSSDIKEVDVREQKLEGDINCFTKDTQHVLVRFVITYYPDPIKIHKLYKQFGAEWAEKIIKPTALGSIRDTVGQYIADDIVGKLDQAKHKAESELMANLKGRDIFLTRLDFVGVDFDNAYKQAIEAKVVAVQKAAEAKNKTVEIEERAKQSIIAAEAEAKSMTIRSQALQQNKGLVEYEAVQKWDGKLPVYMLGNGALPFINIK